MDILPWEVTLSKSFYLSSEKGSTLKGKNLKPDKMEIFNLCYEKKTSYYYNIIIPDKRVIFFLLHIKHMPGILIYF